MFRFITPRELKARVEHAAAQLPPGDFVRRAGNQRLKDEWCAAHFGIGYERYVRPCRLWVNPDQNSDTDFVLNTEHGDFPFQSTISDIPGRRMGDDHKPSKDGRFPLRSYEPDCGTIEGPSWIASAVQRKVAVSYSAARDLNLLVYANFSTNGLNYRSVLVALRNYFSEFASIWVVTNHQVCSVTSCVELGEIPELRVIYDERELAAL